MNYRKGFIALLLASLAFSINGVFSKLVLEAGLSPLRLAEVRSTGAFSAFFIYLLLFKRSALRFEVKALPEMLIYGIVGYAGVQAFYFIADYHALTTVRTPDDLRLYTREAAIDLISLGLDPTKATLFRQSDIPEVTELTWLLMTVTQMHLLDKCHAYKDKKAKGIAADAGLFTYPVLMAADILLYDSDLVPKYEDPGGHAAGIKAPGGVVIRTDTEGSAVQLVAGGLRNPYDLAFNRDGDLFIHDADMESDEGTAWYRPTRLCHIIPGGEYGWRSGWSKWPEYYVDSLPAVIDTGRGSPAGIVAYNHFTYAKVTKTNDPTRLGAPLNYNPSTSYTVWNRYEFKQGDLKGLSVGAGLRHSASARLSGDPLNVVMMGVSV